MSSSFMQCPHPNCDRCLAIPRMIQAGPQNARPAFAPKSSVFKSFFKRGKTAFDEEDEIIDAKYTIVSDEKEECEYVRATFVVEGGEKFVCRRGAIKRRQEVGIAL